MFSGYAERAKRTHRDIDFVLEAFAQCMVLKKEMSHNVKYFDMQQVKKTTTKFLHNFLFIGINRRSFETKL